MVFFLKWSRPLSLCCCHALFCSSRPSCFSVWFVVPWFLSVLYLYLHIVICVIFTPSWKADVIPLKKIFNSVYYLIRTRYSYCGLNGMVDAHVLPCLLITAFENLSNLNVFVTKLCVGQLSISEAPTEHRALRVGLRPPTRVQRDFDCFSSWTPGNSSFTLFFRGRNWGPEIK